MASNTLANPPVIRSNAHVSARVSRVCLRQGRAQSTSTANSCTDSSRHGHPPDASALEQGRTFAQQPNHSHGLASDGDGGPQCNVR